ncbi:ribose 5-phosphate isomerase B [Fusobacterium perfoetens]|uniref:ribose 5-phosphate isomerase B n=1 Tax=Fusobacterium perfoetens TaxID=852 RepID=UPI00047F5631|nr:ribose 5-phosphate isomerase B [Fusobacterium perfoetens]MCI6153108.1 ribose 5-phosphate isomerase B [Fusobacterium perfoetens]MDY3236920.1 ribose 5-phosphate isomerase B [Fusobacterium perfoetens]
MKIALGCDHGGYELKETVKKHLLEKGYKVLDLGCHSTESVNYPIYGKAVGEAVVKKEADYGIVICGTGIGISIAANKVKGVRAALCMNTTMARLTREHNNANVLAFGARMVGDVLALEMVDTFLTTDFAGGRHTARVEMLED